MDSTKNAQKQQFGESSEEPGRVESSISLSCSSPTKETCLNDSFIENTSITSTTIQSIDLPNLDENGHLNWSEQKQQLTKLLSKGKCSELFKLNKQIILTLNISKNCLRSFDCCILPLENCFEIDASQNELVQLLQFLPLTQTLLKLNLADNRINSISCLNNFVNIQWINFSHNRIESLPLLDNLHYLSTLILNSNRLRAIPNLSKLEVLTELGLHGNLIRSFEHIHSLIPSTIRILDLGGNLVSDLCQVSFLRGFTNLESLTLLGNSFCSSNGYKFSYRPFVYSCVLSELKILDGVCLSEGEVIKGEWLHSSGKTRCFLPGSHLQLCSFLSIECPLVSIEMPIVGGGDEERLKKVIQKRREYNQNLQNYYSTPSLLLLEKSQASTTTTSPLNPSFSLTPTPRGRGTIINKNINFSENEKNGTKNWRINTITQSEGKHLAKNNTTTIYTPTSISAAGVNATETTKTSKNNEEEIKRHEDENNVSTTTLTETTTVHPSKNLSKFGILRSATIHSPTPTTSRLTTSSKVCQIVRNATFTHPTPPPILKNTKIPILGKTAEKKKSKGSGGCFRSVLTQKLRRRSNTCNTAPSSTTKLNDQTRIQLLQKRIDKLDEQNAELLNIGEDNVKTLQQMADKLKEVENVLSDQINQNKKLQDLLLPTPINLKQQQVEGTNNILITWENTLPILNSINHYEVFVNDQQMGKVVARNKRLMITDINSFDDLRVSIQARFSQLNNAHSKRAEITLKKEGEDEEESATVRMALYFVALKLLFF